MLTHHPLLNQNKIITQPFGPANWDAVYVQHDGEDFGGSFDVFSAKAGTVIFAGKDPNKDPKWKGGYGNYVIVDHGIINGKRVLTLYAHLQSIRVKVGDKVKGGQYLGPSDTTGYATGPHLHFGVKIDGKWVDPQPYLNNLIAVPVATSSNDAVVTGYDINMRSDPAMKENIIGTLAHGTSVTILADPVEADGYSWSKIQITGYVATKLITKQ